MNHQELKVFVISSILSDEFRGTNIDKTGTPDVRIELKNNKKYVDSNIAIEEVGYFRGQSHGVKVEEPQIRLSFDIDGIVTCYTHYGSLGDGAQFTVAYYEVTGRFSCLASITPEGDTKKFFVVEKSHRVTLNIDVKDIERVVDPDHFPESAKNRARALIEILDKAVANRLNQRGEQNRI
ncbi:hypothetical protein [Nitratireductor sp. XY-223]|uniref:hypothetical protein n=1 Tax=Nitratireductor sp. XY-223 TaxID=2561926 RepID=UPI0010AA5167|nr:hypothetical protein [Nitratireductor sp. XY-223]